MVEDEGVERVVVVEVMSIKAICWSEGNRASAWYAGGQHGPLGTKNIRTSRTTRAACHAASLRNRTRPRTNAPMAHAIRPRTPSTGRALALKAICPFAAQCLVAGVVIDPTPTVTLTSPSGSPGRRIVSPRQVYQFPLALEPMKAKFEQDHEQLVVVQCAQRQQCLEQQTGFWRVQAPLERLAQPT